MTESSHGPRGWVLPVATIALGLLGVGALATAVLVPSAPQATDAVVSATPTPTAAPIVRVAPGEDADTSTRGISELVDSAWVERMSAQASIPERALAAYAGASLAVSRTQPGCGLGWNTVAAIGQVESAHGTIGGSRIGADGVATPAIFGIALDGGRTLAVRDTDGGALDGDAEWDRAVGPLQFIPETWVQYGRDGSGDGVVDIHQIDDAALTAAEYLCVAGRDLTTGEGWIAAVNAYNPSVEYNNRVAEAANHYATLR